MTKKLPQSILHKFVFQADYKPYLKFYDLFYSAAQKLSGYNHWETNRLYVFLHDYEKHCTLAVRHNIIAYEWDYRGTDNYISDVSDALEILPSALEIKTFKRLGFRQQLLIPTNMRFEEINNILNLKFFSQVNQLTNLFPSGVNDMSYIAVGSDDELDLRIMVGPMKKEEITNHIKINQKYNFAPNRPDDYTSILSSYPEVSVYIDIDIFRRDEEIEIPADYALDFLEKADAMVQNKLVLLKEYIFAR
ncbi:MAG: hypothetical protein H6632_10225 [Anaerolineales bacterium]|nr:hypothetical protein [Anaerolineales bacterium]